MKRGIASLTGPEDDERNISEDTQEFSSPAAASSKQDDRAKDGNYVVPLVGLYDSALTNIESAHKQESNSGSRAVKRRKLNPFSLSWKPTISTTAGDTDGQTEATAPGPKSTDFFFGGDVDNVGNDTGDVLLLQPDYEKGGFNIGSGGSPKASKRGAFGSALKAVRKSVKKGWKGMIRSSPKSKVKEDDTIPHQELYDSDDDDSNHHASYLPESYMKDLQTPSPSASPARPKPQRKTIRIMVPTGEFAQYTAMDDNDQ